MADHNLSDKQLAFADAYLKSFNATKAAKEAGYSEKTAYSQGSRLLKDVEIKKYLRARYEETAMDADELLHLLAEIARGDMDDAANEFGNLDMLKARENGKTRLLKSLRNRAVTTDDSTTYETEFAMYDRLKAMELIGKHLAMFTDRTDITSGGKELKALTELSDDELSRIAAGRG